MKQEELRELSQKILKGAQQGVNNAIEEHRRMGRSIVIMRDGKIVEIPPEEIEPREIVPVQKFKG